MEWSVFGAYPMELMNQSSLQIRPYPTPLLALGLNSLKNVSKFVHTSRIPHENANLSYYSECDVLSDKIAEMETRCEELQIELDAR